MTDLELAAEHKYIVTPGGKPMVSVTRIAKLIDDGRSEALMKWADRLALEGKNHIEERDAKGDLGTRIHNHMLSWNKGEGVDALDDELPYLDAAEKWKIDYQPENVEHEQVVVSSLGYGGRFDTVERIDGVIWGIDYKSGRLNDRENELQHAGYWFSDGIAEYDEAGMLTNVRSLPPIQRWASLQLHDDGTYLFQEYPKRRRGQKDIPTEVLQVSAWASFQNLLDVYVWLHPTKGIA